MSKAEEAEQRALEAYPVLMCYNDFQMAEEDINKPLRKIYQEGYHQAEQDLKLTWEDVKLLQDISGEVFAEVARGSVDYYQIYPTQQSFLEEVLKRFNEERKKE